MATSDTKLHDSNADNFSHFIAIDFGTSGSGIAVHGKGYKEIMVYMNPKWVPKQIGMAVKCPTALLLDPYGKFEAFGLTAIESYQNKRGLRYPEKSEEYYFFNRFKMCLYDEKYLSHDMKIKAANGKELLAREVIAKSLWEMKRMILESLNETIGPDLNEVLWIVTVPAIWSPGAKQIMREAAIEAGLTADKGSSLMFVLEPEAAAMFCQKEILDAIQDNSNKLGTSSDQNTDSDLDIISKLDIGNELISHYLVVDCGGGTVDIVAHKLTRTSDGKVSIEEIHQAHGGPHGGFVVNDEFENMLEKLFQLTKEGIEEIKYEFARLWTKLIYIDFENDKCRIDSKSVPITIDLKSKMLAYLKKKTGKDISQLVEEYKCHKIEWDDDDEGLVLPISTINSLFTPVISQIVTAIKQVLGKPECHCIKKILLVGGFAESSILFEEVKKEFSPAITVKKSKNPSVSVLKGAIMYGRNKNIIKSRKMSQSIGIETWDDFDPSIHDENRKVVSGGKVYCTKVFTKLVDINESVNVEQCLKCTFPLTSEDQDCCSIRIFGSRHSKTFYTDEDGCYEVGVITVTGLPKYESGKPQMVQVELNVSGTEVTVFAYCDGQIHQLPATLDCVKDKYTQKNKI